MTIDDKMKHRLSAFTRRWNSMRAQLGHMLDSTTTEIKDTPPPARMSSRARRSYDEASVVRVPASPEELEASKVVGEALHDAWREGEMHVSLTGMRGYKPTLRDMTARQRDPNVIPGPHSAEQQAGMTHGPAASFMPKKPDEPVPGGVVYDPKTDTIRKTD